MKKSKNAVILAAVFLLMVENACAQSQSAKRENTPQGEKDMIAVNVIVNGKNFAALFYDTQTTQKLIAKMPLTIVMSNLNEKEKFFHLNETLTTAPTEQPSTIYTGEIMCWTGSSLVLFYATFANTYGGYVRLGYIKDTTGLVETLGTGSVTVTFSLP